jgi:hypothetical protein
LCPFSKREELKMTSHRSGGSVALLRAAAASAVAQGWGDEIAREIPPATNEANGRTESCPGAPGRAVSESRTDITNPMRPSDPAVPRVTSGPQNEANSRTETYPDAPPRTVSAACRSDMPLEPRQVMAARVLLSGMGTVQASARLGVERHAIWRWKKDPRFQAEVRRLAGEVVIVSS